MLWVISAQIPRGYEQLALLQESVGHAVQILARGAVAALGVAIVQTKWRLRALGIAGIALGTTAILARLVAVELIPAVAEFLFAMYAVASSCRTQSTRRLKRSDGRGGSASREEHV